MNATAALALINLVLLGYEWNRSPFLKNIGADGYQRRQIHLIGKLPRRHGRLLSAPRGPSNKEHQPSDREIAEQLEKEHAEQAAAYLSPMEAAKLQGIDQRALIETFGEAYTPENVKKREERSAKMMRYLPPDVPPTNMLPYFVNLQNPENPLGDIVDLQEETTDADTGTEGFAGDSEGQTSLDELHQENSMQDTGGKSVFSNESAVSGSDPPQSAQTAEETNAESTADSTKGEDNGRDVDTGNVQNGAAKSATFDKRAELALFQDPREELFFANEAGKFEGDPLDPYFEAAAQPASDDEEGVDPAEAERSRVAWYRDKPKNRLFPADMVDGWSILPCGRIYKHLLRPSHLPPEEQRKPGPEAYVSFGFKFVDAFTGSVLLEHTDMEGDGIISQLKTLGTGLQKMLSSMVTGEQAEFICHAIELDIADLKVEGLENLGWIRAWINLITLHKRGERWWHLSPLEAPRYPQPDPEHSKLTEMERLNLKTDQLRDQIETELANNPCSPLWDDVLRKLTAQQKASVVEHFDKKLEMQERRKCAEYSGSRGFGDAIKSTGQLDGYDVGRCSGGCGTFYAWHETPFIIYIAIPVAPGVRAEHVDFKLEPRHLTLRVANKIIIDDDMMGQVDTEISSSWVMSEKAMEYEALPAGHPELREPVLKVSQEDEYHKLIKDPCIVIALKKQEKVMGDWGTPFANI